MQNSDVRIPPPPPRPRGAHKGTFGTVAIFGGSHGMIGAPAMTATAAFRVGAGLVKIITHPELLHHCITIEPSATGISATLDNAADALDSIDPTAIHVVGPGMGVDPAAERLIHRVIEEGRPLLLDADGLNNLALMGDNTPPTVGPLVLTPHPGEYRRLAEAAKIAHDPTDPRTRPDAAAAIVKRYGGVCVLKGAGTIVHDGERCYTNSTGNPALSAAGSGDVLCGVIAGLMAQGMPPFNAAVLGVYLHGKAADTWAAAHGSAGLLARELAALIPDALEGHRRNS